MTVATTTNKTGNFVVGVSAFPFTFPVFNQDDLDVNLVDLTSNIETKLVRGTAYSVSLLYSGAGGGTVTLDPTLYPTGIPTGYYGYVKRVLDETQEIDLKNQGDWFPEQHEEAFDRAVMLIQQIQEQSDRSMKTDNNGTWWDALSKRIVNLADGTGDNDAVNRKQMVDGDSATYAAAVAAAFAAMISWVTNYVVNYWPLSTPISNVNMVTPTSQTINAGQTRIYFPVPVHGIILTLGGITQAYARDFIFTPGQNYIDLVEASPAESLCSAFIYTSSVGATAFSQDYVVLAAGGTVATMTGGTWDTGIVFANGVAQVAVKDYAHNVGSSVVTFNDPVPAPTVVLVVKFS